MSGYKPRVGDRVRTYIEGVVEGYDEDAGHWFVRGNGPGSDHVAWLHTFHWGQEFEPVVPPEPAWYPPQIGDIVRYENSTYIYMPDPDYWVNASESVLYPAGLIDAHKRGVVSLLVRGGKAVPS